MITYFIIALFFIAAYFAYKKIRILLIDKKFGITRRGLNGGKLIYINKEKRAEINWDSLMGENVFLIYNKNLQWMQPNNIDFTLEEKKLFYKVLFNWSEKRKVMYTVEYKRPQ